MIRCYNRDGIRWLCWFETDDRAKAIKFVKSHKGTQCAKAECDGKVIALQLWGSYSEA